MKEKRTTIKDIAEAVGVSKALVSFALSDSDKGYRVSEEMTKKILATAKEMNYKPNNAARSLRSGRTRTIGVILSDIANKFFADIARCIEDRAYEKDYAVIFGSSDENPAKLESMINVLLTKGVDGLVIVPCEKAEKAIKAAAEKVPVVLLDRYIDGADIDCVVLNNRKAVKLGVEALYNNGARNIEMIGYDLDLSNVKDREAGYIAAMKQYDLGARIRVHKARYKYIFEDVDEISRSILERKGTENAADAIIFATNSLTLAGLKSFYAHGLKVPDDVAVVGFDGSEAFELFYTSIAYIKQPIDEFGKESLDLLLRSIDEKAHAKVATVSLIPEFVEGESAMLHRDGQ